MMTRRYIGIDIGTSSTLVKLRDYDPAGKTYSPIKTLKVDGKEFIPSVAFVLDDCFGTPDNFRFAASALSCQLDGKLYRNFKMMLISDDAGDQLKAREIVGHFLEWLRKKYEEQLKSYFGQCDEEFTTISYPERWSEELRTFMVKAATDAGFKNVKGIDEAQAAIDYLLHPNLNILPSYSREMKKTSMSVMLFDMGAGTTDIAIGCYDLKTNNLHTLSRYPRTTSDISYGGADFDNRIFRIIDDYLRDNGIVVQDEHARRRILTACKDWKEAQLSVNVKVDQTIRQTPGFVSFLCQNKPGCAPFPHIDRRWFEEKFSEEIDAFASIVELALNQAVEDGALSSRKDIDLVVLTGGHSQWYFIPELLKGNQKSPNGRDIAIPSLVEVPDRLLQISNPSETVALGLVCDGMEAENTEIPSVDTIVNDNNNLQNTQHEGEDDSMNSTDDTNNQQRTLNNTVKKLVTDSPLNLLVMGKAGVGKTTLVNAMFNTAVGTTGAGLPITKGITRYEIAGFPFVVYETEGLEVNSNQTILDDIKNKIVDKSAIKDPMKMIHAIFYCISHLGEKIDTGEATFIRELDKAFHVPIYIVLTKAYMMEDTINCVNDPLVTCCKSILQLPVKGYYPVLCEKYTLPKYNVTIEPFGVDRLVEDFINRIGPELKDYIRKFREMSIQQRVETAKKWLWGHALASTAIAAATPAVVDIAALIANETAMVGTLTATLYSGEDMEKRDKIVTAVSALVGPLIASVAGSIAYSEISKAVSYAVGILTGGTGTPVIIAVQGSAGIVAGGITLAMGRVFIATIVGILEGKIDVDHLNVEQLKKEMKLQYAKAKKEVAENKKKDSK